MNKNLFDRLNTAADLPKTVRVALDSITDILMRAPYDVNHEEALKLLEVYNVAYHESGKIEGAFSLDSSCNGCTFCDKMRAAAAKDPNIICGMCYDHKFEAFRVGSKYRHMLNLLIMSSVLFTAEELATLPGGYITRINASGDIENLIHARNMIRYAKAHPDYNIGFWAKNYTDVVKAFEIEGKPANVRFIASSPVIDKPIKAPKFADNTFTVYSTKEKVQTAIAGGSGECNGKKCRACGYKCYTGYWKAGADIAELLRK